MRDWSPERVAVAAGAVLAGRPPASPSSGSLAGADGPQPQSPAWGAEGAAGGRRGPSRVTIDSRDVRPGDLFVGLPGTRVDGGGFAAGALHAGAWGVVVAPGHVSDARCAPAGTVLACDDPLAALQSLARAWRRELGAQVVAITGSTGKTSTKDLLAAMARPSRRTVASEQNLNTEIGVPLTILGAPAGTEVLVLELAMRGAGQIAELAAIAEPDVGVILNVGPVHLELLGTLERVAAAKAELLEGLRGGATAILPADEPLLDRHRRADLRVVTFGAGGDVEDLGDVEIPFTSAHMRLNALAALAAARAVGIEPHGMLDVALSDRRGQRIELPGAVVVIDDCYNANPMSMRAALDDLRASASGRSIAVLGDMLELGADAVSYHEEIGEHAAETGVDMLVAVGPLAAHMGARFHGERHFVPDAVAAASLAQELVRPGDTVLVKASRGVGLEAVAEGLRALAATGA
ncbi:MAG TPA: UDP-N-acetylmuramoyl-tripeptide--D-alanyl-D-alanine ligase [Solirubrobacteraceae bacterium]